jgi:hypothetical protein
LILVGIDKETTITIHDNTIVSSSFKSSKIEYEKTSNSENQNKEAILPTKNRKIQKNSQKRLTKNQNLYEESCAHPLTDRISVQSLNCKSIKYFHIFI